MREGARLKGVSYAVEPQLPVDVLGVYVFLPAAGCMMQRRRSPFATIRTEGGAAAGRPAAAGRASATRISAGCAARTTTCRRTSG